jgi:hypothetical protein
MVGPTRREWLQDALAATEPMRCHSCGLDHLPTDIDPWGNLWGYCLHIGGIVYLGWTEPPLDFAPEPDPAADPPA